MPICLSSLVVHRPLSSNVNFSLKSSISQNLFDMFVLTLDDIESTNVL